MGTAVRLVAAALVGAIVATAVLLAWPERTERLPPPAVALGSEPSTWSLAPYEGLGAWVDVFDFVPEGDAATATITPEHLRGLAGFGVRTLFLQAATGQTLDVVAPDLLAEFLVTAHELGMRVVAWYLPFLSEPPNDLARLRAVTAFTTPEGHRFDGLALDIEWTQGVADPAERSRRLVELSRETAELTDGGVVGAIVPPPVQLEDVNPDFWPGFPWAELGEHHDVFLPMDYWTERLDPWDDPYLLTSASMTRLRARVGDPDLPVHPIGGVADSAAEGDYPPFLRAADEHGAIGYSVYDYRSITVGGMALLSATSTAAPSTTPPTTTDTMATTTTRRTTTSTTAASRTTTTSTTAVTATTGSGSAPSPAPPAPPTTAAPAPTAAGPGGAAVGG